MTTSQREDPTAYEIIFSCSICQATIHDIYDNDHGIVSGDSTANSISTRLWLTECAHLTCGKHLEGGGVPFHPVDQQPTAPCPRCILDRQDNAPKRFFGVRGHQDGQYDKHIPKKWFDTPPTNLQELSEDTEAIRFQYLSLIQFGTGLLKSYRSLQASHSKLQQRLAHLDEAGVRITRQLNESKQQVATLSEEAAKYSRFKAKEPQIRHYLGVFSKCANENTHLKKQLYDLGFEVPQTDYSYAEPPISVQDGPKVNRMSSGASPDSAIDVTEDERRSGDLKRHMNAAPAQQSHRTISSGETECLSSNKKRKIDNAESQAAQRGSYLSHAQTIAHPNSRDLMPPPKATSRRQYGDKDLGSRPQGSFHEIAENPSNISQSYDTPQGYGGQSEIAHEVPQAAANGHYMSGALMSPPRQKSQTQAFRQRSASQPGYEESQNLAHDRVNVPHIQLDPVESLPFLKPHRPTETSIPRDSHPHNESFFQRNSRNQNAIADTQHEFTFSKPYLGADWARRGAGTGSGPQVEYPWQDPSKRSDQSWSVPSDQNNTYETASRFIAAQHSSPRKVDHDMTHDSSVASPFFKRRPECSPTMHSPYRRTDERPLPGATRFFPPRTQEHMRAHKFMTPSMATRNTSRLSFMQSPQDSRNRPFPWQNDFSHQDPASMGYAEPFQRSGLDNSNPPLVRRRPAGLVAPLPNAAPYRSATEQSDRRQDVDPRVIFRGSKMASSCSHAGFNQRPSSVRPHQQKYFGNAAVRRSVLR